jgi:hypothetical protein
VPAGVPLFIAALVALAITVAAARAFAGSLLLLSRNNGAREKTAVNTACRC